MNVEPTALAIDLMAMHAEDMSRRLKDIAQNMRNTNDISYAAEAVQEVANIMVNFRLDLLVTRPIREFLVK